MTDSELVGRVEVLVDGASVKRVLAALSMVCEMKAGHIRESWQDEELSREWHKVACAIERLEGKTEV